MCDRPVIEVLKVSDVPAEYRDTITAAGVAVRLITQRTGFGYRRYFLCPTCGRKCGKLYRYRERLYCQHCIPLDLYRSRRSLYDEDSHRLIVWHMDKLAETISDQPIKYPFDLVPYLGKPPPHGMSWKRYVKVLEKLQRMEQLRIAAIFHGCRFTAREIKEYTNELWPDAVSQE